MKIGIDSMVLGRKYQHGSKRYVEELIKSLAKVDKRNEYYVFSSNKTNIPRQKNFNLVVVPRSPVLNRQLLLSLLVNRTKLDVFHATDPYGSVFLRNRNIVTTVHDIDLGWTYPLFSKYFLNRIFCEVIRFFIFKKSRMFIVPSNQIKKELRERLDNKVKDGIFTVRHGLNFNHFKKSNSNNHGKHFLCMADFSDRKNITNILLAYKNLPSTIKEKYFLKIVYSRPEYSGQLKQTIMSLKLNKNVKVINGATDKKLVTLYNQAFCFIFPSFYEGFGFPIIEAMGCGCPVITSNYGAMKETAGMAALFVDPSSVESITNSILKLINSKRLLTKMIKLGQKRSLSFRWENTAKKTLAIYLRSKTL